jgi:AcrR family transcriptional regulator
MSTKERKKRSDGERSRNAILREAAQLATVEGLAGLSIARLADAVGMSKSGLFAHFGSKEELQLATIDMASEIFKQEVLDPAEAAQTGLERLRMLSERFICHVEEGVFPGGCFFASVLAEMDTHPGPVRDRALQTVVDWTGRLVDAVKEAQAEGALDRDEDPEQLAFEIDAYLCSAGSPAECSAGTSRSRPAIRVVSSCAQRPPVKRWVAVWNRTSMPERSGASTSSRCATSVS